MKSRQYLAALYLHSALVANCPKDTWNLALNGIRIVQDAGKFYVVVGGESAPYAHFTNEKWEKGTNPNEGWVERTIEMCLPYIKQIMSGTISTEEVNQIIQDDFYKNIAEQRADWVARKEMERDSI